jgi:hypothetical protein
MGNSQNSEVSKGLLDGVLDKQVGGHVNSSGSFVENKHLGLGKNSTSNAEALALSK